MTACRLPPLVGAAWKQDAGLSGAPWEQDAGLSSAAWEQDAGLSGAPWKPIDLHFPPFPFYVLQGDSARNAE